ncbi:MAG: thioredoxin-disulfide reductase [Calditrichae bacterium]|nr:thioredoxin-disulfide reductase [Calditrichota bacterium]MCB9059701.1 thioredoxin-disulfide reductase [Calditrichia bacterium]
MNTDYDVIVLGGGPAGLTAGIYLARGKHNTLILNEGAIGGQTVLTHEVANYPGVENINGYQLARIMKKQATDFGCKIRSNVKVTNLELSGPVKKIEINNKDTFSAKAVILSPGGRSRELGVPGENEFKGKGISYCATCDGDFFQDKEIIVVGGGNSAIEEADALTRYASKVTVVHQFDHFQAYEHAVRTAKENPKIEFIMESTIAEFKGEGKLEAVTVKNLKTAELTELPIDGVFIFIGYVPNTEVFKDVISLNNYGEIEINQNFETNIPGVFAAGDAIQKRYRQITTAVSDGTIAALNTMEYLHD